MPENENETLHRTLSLGPRPAADLPPGFLPSACVACDGLIPPLSPDPVIVCEEYLSWSARQRGHSLPVVFHTRCLDPRRADDARLLTHAARRAAGDPSGFFVASALIAYQLAHDLDDAGLARWLGMDAANLPRLALCRRPTLLDPAPDVLAASLARFVGCDAERLAEVLG